MTNYIILENRAELTTAEVLSGMNFSAIVAGAASTSADVFGDNSFGIGFMSKGFLAVLIVVGGIAVFKNYPSYKEEATLGYTEMNQQEHLLMRKGGSPHLIIETIPPKNSKYLVEYPNAACQPGNSNHSEPTSNHMTRRNSFSPLVNIDSLNALEEKKPVTTVPNQMVQMPPQLTCKTEAEMKGNGMTEEPKIYYTTVPFNASPNAKSYLWQPASFNKNVEEASGQFKMDCNGCDFSYISGTQLDGKNYKGVWMRVTKDKKIKFKLETGLKNISLIRTVGDKCIATHPIAVGIDGPQWRQKEWTYISNKFKTNSATYTFGEHIDFYLIFEDAKVGDKLVIDDFVETLVVEK